MHGPLQAAWLFNHAAELQGAPPSRFAFRGLSPLFDDDAIFLNAEVDGEGGIGEKAPRARRSKAKGVATDLECALTRGMASLPFDARQRARAKELARDALDHFSATRSRAQTAESLAAAVAYAIVYVDHVPLTQAEVAGCFRVRVASLRGRFGELRAHLDLSPGDARYATVRG